MRHETHRFQRSLARDHRDVAVALFLGLERCANVHIVVGEGIGETANLSTGSAELRTLAGVPTWRHAEIGRSYSANRNLWKATKKVLCGNDHRSRRHP